MYYAVMTKEKFERFLKAADAWVDIDGESRWHDSRVASFCKRFAEEFTEQVPVIPANSFDVVYTVGDPWDLAVVWHSVSRANVDLCEKYIEFEDGRRIHFSHVLFYAY